MKQIYPIFENTKVLLIILVLLLLPFIIKRANMLFHYMRPYRLHSRTEQWLRHLELAVGGGNSETVMRELARKQTLRKIKHSNLISRVQWRVYLNLQSVRRQLRKTPAQTISTIPASLWVFDNYNLLYREIKKFQGTGNLSELSRLPVLETGYWKGCPRIYIIAREIIAATNNHPQEKTIINLLNAYQNEKQLKSQELWSFGMVMSLCLLEKIVDEAVVILQSIHIKIRASRAAEKIAAALRSGSIDVTDVLKTEIDKTDSRNEKFITHFFFSLRNMSVDESDVVVWLSKVNGMNREEYLPIITEVINRERQREAMAESLISSLIISLKEIGDLNWGEVFKQVSRMEDELQKDPAEIYSLMDENTRSRYRRKAEKLAARFRLQESAVAQKAVQLANMYHLDPEAAERKSTDNSLLIDARITIPDHVGTYLVGSGYASLIDLLSNRPVRLHKFSGRRKLLRGIIYLSGIFVITAALLFFAFHAGRLSFERKPLLTVLLFLQLGILAVGIAIHLINTVFSRLIHPLPQLAMDFSKGIPDMYRTFVVMPVILGSESNARSYAARLEKYYLANKQSNLYFAILGDLKDADAKIMDEDSSILHAAITAIQVLNEKYPGAYARFSLFLRQRQWNESEKCWMCWERKRGKLEEFNALLSGEPGVAFDVRIGSSEMFSSFRYVITLDADTDLIRESAVQLIGIMAHPLNQPVIDEKNNRIISGYAIVQSEISSRITDTKASFFSRLFAGESGIDKYATVISDIYQDTFDEGIFVGKGIYDFRIMHRLLRGMISKNTVLSHDLLESSLTRCAFASGIRMLDTTPPSVAAFALRDHRWIRGDWQLIPWIFSRSRINWLSRWKMIDNLRRSLMPVASVLAILIMAVFFPAQAWIWVPFVFFSDIWRFVISLGSMIFHKLTNPSIRVAFQILFEQLSSMLVQTSFNILLLPFNAFLSLDAIIRTLYRVLISHRNMLEWQTSESAEKNLENSYIKYIKLMWPSAVPAVGLCAATVLWGQMPSAVIQYALVAAWICAPAISFLASQPSRISTKQIIKPEDVRDLRLLARRTWRFFEDYATVDNNWLCPDNLQQFPGPQLSEKTSPTNIGLQLVAALSACDFGFIGLRSLVVHCEAVMRTINRMTKWNGHLYNWYNVKTLELLAPQYVSTVDSGNFLTYLITLKNGLQDLAKEALFPDTLLLGLKDSLACAGLDPDLLTGSFVSKESRDELLRSLHTAAESPDISIYWQHRLAESADTFESDMVDFEGPDGFASKLSLESLAKLGQANAAALMETIRIISMQTDELVRSADFRFLYNNKLSLFHIGYNASNQSADIGLYDLLASEARITSFLAIAKGDVPQKNWFTLGRPLTLVKGVPTLVSWSGTMFEYLMPNLIMKTPYGTMLGRSCTAAVNRQIIHGKKEKIPWGISESQYFLFDTDSNYQYSAFGMQYLRLKSSMKPARVVAPYATALALGTMRRAAINNLRQLQLIGACGEYGLYESLDFSRPDSAAMKPYSLVQSFMAHHQGMILASINNCLHANVLQKRFHEEAMVKATSVLLEETSSAVLVSLARRGYSINIELEDFEEEKFESRYCSTIDTKVPVAHVLSNNHYLLMLTSGGQGFSSCDDIMLNSWRPESTGSSHGSFVYIRNLDSDYTWSYSYHPTFVRPEEYQVIFSADKVEYHRRDGMINTDTEITLSPIDNFEIRRITLSNHSERDLNFEFTSYMEVVNDLHLAEASHPAFNKLFLELELVQDRNLMIASRRKRSEDDKNGVVMHMVMSDSKFIRAVEYETDRRSFIGRGGTLDKPMALKTRLPLPGRTGFSIDPIMSLRVTVAIPANKSVSVSFITGFCPTREAVLKLCNDLRKTLRYEDLFRLALTSSKLEMKYLNMNSQQLNAIQSLVGPLYYPSRQYRDRKEIISRNVRGQSSLWRFGISGDYPIILLRVKDLRDLTSIKDTLLAYEFLCLQTVRVNLVIVNEEDEGYGQPLMHAILDLTGAMKVYNNAQQKPGLFVLRRFLLTNEESDLLSTVARIVIERQTGIYMPLYDILSSDKDLITDNILLPAGDSFPLLPESASTFIPPVSLEFFNGIGGFASDGQEYEMWLGTNRKTPAPWINVIANEKFGFLVSETGAGYTWAGNSRENKITNWSNDPILDPASEAVYIKDKETGAITSPASLRPGRGQGYLVRHGFGYSVFTHAELDLEQSMTLFSATEDPVKIWLINIRDHSGQDRNLSVTLYVEWVLGVLKEQCAPYIVTQYNAQEGVLFARNVYSEFNQQRPAFIFASEPVTSFTGDKKSFLGIGRSVSYPIGLAAEKLSGETGACFDPCGVIQMEFHLAAGAKKTIVLGLGQAGNIIEACELADKFRSVQSAQDELERIHSYWNSTLSRVRVNTPNRASDILLNGWLPYQIISCRLRARSAFYQCGGAFGFRDQLQDVLAVLDIDSGLAETQIRLCSAHQFMEGDVQHWWHPVTGSGVRTRISDDMLWLPYVTAAFVEHTGQSEILQEQIPFLEGDILGPKEAEKMFVARVSEKTDTIYKHCLMAIDRASQFGVNGLPLMGGGDWNDGMNRVGIEGKGESVWLGWFLYAVIKKFLPLCLLMKDQGKYDQLNSLAELLRSQIEQTAWDGNWYLRGFFDNGNLLGSHANEECQIDSVSQSWAVLSGAADPARALQALESAQNYLVHQEDGVIQLLTPPFNKSMPDPGYIKGYFPGIRENGGQYTHAAIWLAMANAVAGRGAVAYELLNMLNPILETSTVKDVSRYEKEPYVMSADIYMGGQFTGKAGWSWYTGSAGWMYQSLLHTILGVSRRQDRLFINPAFPAAYTAWQIDYHYGTALYRIKVENDSGNGNAIESLTIDGTLENGNNFIMHDDSHVHTVVVKLTQQNS